MPLQTCTCSQWASQLSLGHTERLIYVMQLLAWKTLLLPSHGQDCISGMLVRQILFSGLLGHLEFGCRADPPSSSQGQVVGDDAAALGGHRAGIPQPVQVQHGSSAGPLMRPGGRRRQQRGAAGAPAAAALGERGERDEDVHRRQRILGGGAANMGQRICCSMKAFCSFPTQSRMFQENQELTPARTTQKEPGKPRS